MLSAYIPQIFVKRRRLSKTQPVRLTVPRPSESKVYSLDMIFHDFISTESPATNGIPPPTYSERKAERCPPYSCSVAYSSVLIMKNELSTPTTLSKDRSWKVVYAEVKGTMLRVKAVQAAPQIRCNQLQLPMEQASQLSLNPHQDRIYTLQGGEAGIAAGYTKRKFVIRVRAGAEQFLFATSKLSSMLSWIEALNAAISISLPLETRMMPKQRTLPRPTAMMIAAQRVSMKQRLSDMWARCVRTEPPCTSHSLQSRSGVRISPQAVRLSALTTQQLTVRPQHSRPSSICSTLIAAEDSAAVYPLTPTIDPTRASSEVACATGGAKWCPTTIVQPDATILETARRCSTIVSYSGPRAYKFYVKADQTWATA